MSFKEVLAKLGESMDGVLAAIVIAEDGIIVEKNIVDPGFDAELAGVEYVGGCRDIGRAMESLQAGGLEEVTVVAEKSRMLLRTISPGYFIILALRPGSSVGKGRYLARKASYELAPEFL